eukprot:2499918-Rhodomonas_salina.3
MVAVQERCQSRLETVGADITSERKMSGMSQSQESWLNRNRVATGIGIVSEHEWRSCLDMSGNPVSALHVPSTPPLSLQP